MLVGFHPKMRGVAGRWLILSFATDYFLSSMARRQTKIFTVACSRHDGM